jgi:chromosome segregation ATPase
LKLEKLEEDGCAFVLALGNLENGAIHSKEDVSALTSKLETAETEIKTLTAKLAKETDDCCIFMGKLSKSEKETARSNEEVITLTAKLEELSVRLGEGSGYSVSPLLKQHRKEISTLTSRLGKAEEEVRMLTMSLEATDNEVKRLSSKLGEMDMVESIKKDIDDESLIASRLMKSEKEIQRLKEAAIEEKGFVTMERDSWNAEREKLDAHCASLERKVCVCCCC